MTLAEIKAFITENGGRAISTRMINLAARELWHSVTLPQIIETCFINAGNNQRVALPWFVHNVTAARRANSGDIIELNTPFPQFNYSEFQQSTCSWRDLGYSPLQKDLRAAGRLTVKKVERTNIEEITLHISGSTETSSFVTEELTITNQTTLIETSFSSVERIEKTSTCNTDLLFLDVADLEVSRLPAHLTLANFQIIQIRDTCCNSVSCDVFKIAYKPVLPPLIRDRDAFPSQIFADAVCWMALGYDKFVIDANAAVPLKDKAAALFKNFANEANQGRVQKQRTQTARPYEYAGTL